MTMNMVLTANKFCGSGETILFLDYFRISNSNNDYSFSFFGGIFGYWCWSVESISGEGLEKNGWIV